MLEILTSAATLAVPIFDNEKFFKTYNFTKIDESK